MGGGGGGRGFGHCFSRIAFLSSFSLSLGGGPVLTDIMSQRAVRPKPTNHPGVGEQ